MIIIKEQFIPVQINQEHCMKCERCLRACRQDAIYFKDSVRLVDYTKCKACLACVQVCPRNAIQVTSVTSGKVLTVKINHEKCSKCLDCVNKDAKFCPNDLFYLKEDDSGKLEDSYIRFKFSEVEKCQGCLQCKLKCETGAIEPVQFII